MFHHDAQLGQLYCLRGITPVVVSGRPSTTGPRCASPGHALPFKHCTENSLMINSWVHHSGMQVVTQLALRLQAAVTDYAQWRHLLADALDLPLSGEPGGSALAGMTEPTSAMRGGGFAANTFSCSFVSSFSLRLLCCPPCRTACRAAHHGAASAAADGAVPTEGLCSGSGKPD